MALWSRPTDSDPSEQSKQNDQSKRQRLADIVHPGWLNRDLSYLFWGRGLRSLSQGYLGVIVPLYLAELHYSAVRLGVIFTAAAAVSAVMSAAVGVLSDRYGRKLFLVILGLLTAAGGAAFAASGAFWVLLIAGAISTVGRGGGAGSGGAWGPYAAAEQALIAEHSGDQHRTSVFGAMSFIGVLTGAVGSLIAGMPSVLQHFFGTTQVDGDRILFFSTIFVGIAMAVVMVPVRETRDATSEPQPGQQRAKSGEKHKLQPATVRLILKFMATNTANGLGYGLLGPITVYWFYRRYGVGSGQMAELFFLINLATAPSYLFAARLAKRLGVVKGITHTRALSVVMLGVMPFMPTYFLAALFYILRMITSTLSNPLRQSYSMGIVPREDRATVAGLSNLPSQICSSIGPTLGGYMIQDLSLNLPLEVAAVFQAINVVLFYGFFHNILPPEEVKSEPQPPPERGTRPESVEIPPAEANEPSVVGAERQGDP